MRKTSRNAKFESLSLIIPANQLNLGQWKVVTFFYRSLQLLTNLKREVIIRINFIKLILMLRKLYKKLVESCNLLEDAAGLSSLTVIILRVGATEKL